ncbi:hypothetical protein GH5_06330 [Leishmania sp. Ghana 2012 LV757]|uniref:hypothetical protein n=1 Tax=Leishmania sp. Ghana 2012 LV757 TaxID=2803181 RepID=UPI001B6DD94F|nr:hypothetical protein GH5_06330 [Leishmania sp. Ghana 2012 LV757]
MLSAGQLSFQLANRHPQPHSQASSLSPAPSSSSSTTVSLLLAAAAASQQPLPASPQGSSQASSARDAASNRISPNSPSASTTAAKASKAANSSDNSHSQLNELGSGRQLCGTPAAPTVAKQLQQHQAGQQTPPHVLTARGPIVPGKFYSSADYPTQCRPRLSSRPPQQQPYEAPPPPEIFNTSVEALTVSSLSRADHPIQVPPCYYNPSPALVSKEPPPLPSLPLQKAQQQRSSVCRRESTAAAAQVVMEPGVHTQPRPSASYSSPYSQSTSSLQQYPQVRTDTTLVSSINSSSTADPASKSASAVVAVSGSGSSCGGLRIAAPHSPVTSPLYQSYPAREQQSHASHHHTSPRGTSSSPRFAVSNTSMTCSSVNELGSPVLRRGLSNPNELYRSQRRNLLEHQAQQQQHCQTKMFSQPFERRNSDTMDTVSRSLNTQNDPELVGLPPMRRNDEEDEDEMVGQAGGVVGAAGNATTLYSKGFLIATSSSAKESLESHHNGGIGIYAPTHMHDGEEQQPPCDDGEGSISQATQSRGPTASASTGISHRLLTVEEINERRRASWVASHSMSQVQSVVADTALDDSARTQKKSRNPISSTQSTNNNLSAASEVSKGSRPAHRQLTKEEADQLIAQRQQQRAAAKGATAHQQQHKPSTSLANTSSINNQSGVSHLSPSDSTKPWLLSGDGTQASYFPPAPASAPPAASTNIVGSGSNVAAKPMSFEWLQGTRGGGAGGGAGYFSESTAHSWPGVHTWRDGGAAGRSASRGNVNAAVAAFLGAAEGAAGDGVPGSDFGAPANTLARAGQALSGTLTAGFTWLPNTSNWTPFDQLQRLQHQEQTVFSLAPPAPLQAGSVSGATNAAPWGRSAGTIGLSGDTLHGGSLTSFPSLLAAVLQGLSQQHIEERIRQCDVQLERLRQEREQLVRELQRRLHSATDGEHQQQPQHNHRTATSWPGALGPNTVTITSRVMSTVPGGPAMPPNGVATEGAGAIGSSGSAVDQSPLWQFFGDLVSDGNVARKAVPRGPADAREPPAPCINPVKGIDTEEWAGRAPAAAADRRRQSGTGAVGGGGGGSVGNWSAGERCGGRNRRRADTGNQRCISDGNNNNGASSSASAVATSSNVGGGGHSTNNRCSHDNTPQEQKYLQTDPFSMYMHNKKIATAGAATTPAGSRDTAA